MRVKGKSIGIYVIVFALVVVMSYLLTSSSGGDVQQVAFSTFTKKIESNEIKELNVEELKLTGETAEGEMFFTYASSIVEINWLNETYIYPQMEEGDVKLVNEEPYKTPWYVSLLPTVIMVLLLVFFWFMMMNQAGGGGKAMQFGKSRAKLQTGSDLKKLTFADVAGLDEEKEELEEVVDFLRNPRKYNNVGARIPKGILLVGPPGTGKTYISRAAAGEAGVPFFTISGSDFVEMFVGVGASRVRDLFEQAKKSSPCIIFIDEIDAVGRQRGAGLGGGHDEREQTLNQLLVEMDGFATNMGIIILAATNRPDILDPALLRPGRFDRQVVIGAPDIKGREEIFRVHSRNKPLAPEVNPKVLARRTPGFTPADIENMLNEAALLTARRDGRFIRMTEIEEAITKVIAGPEKKSRVISEEERKLTAYHEAGHAIVARALPGTDPVHQITIVPRGNAGGFTMILPKEDKYYATKSGMKEQIIHLLGGRVAEMLALDDISTGASNDIMRATEIAKDMVTKYGFSEKLGTVNYSSSDEVFLGKDFSTKKTYSEETASEIDEEVKTIIDSAYKEAKEILENNMEKLHEVSKALLEIETLDGEQFEDLYTGKINADSLTEEVKEKEDTIAKRNKEEAEETRRIIEEEKAREEAELAAYDEDYLNDESEEEKVAQKKETKEKLEEEVVPEEEPKKEKEVRAKPKATVKPKTKSNPIKEKDAEEENKEEEEKQVKRKKENVESKQDKETGKAPAKGKSKQIKKEKLKDQEK